MNFKKLTLVGVAATFVACGSSVEEPEFDGPTGELTFALTFNENVVISTVSGVCRNATNTLRLEKTINVSGNAGRSFQALWGQIPVGTGYVCELRATSVDDRLSCEGRLLNISVTANQTTDARINVQCRDNTPRGNILVTGEFNTCPDINDFEIFPLATTINNTLDLWSSASDLDNDVVDFRWSVVPPDLGTIANPSANRTTFRCDLSGTGTITLTLDDRRGCGFSAGNTVAESASYQVRCVAAGVCGDGVLNPGELCDLGAANADSTNICTAATDSRGACRFKFCGDGVVDPILSSRTNPSRNPPILTEECDDGNRTAGDGCNTLCIREFCGDRIVQAGLGEQCDDGPMGSPTCSAMCRTIVAMCGDGVLNAGEQCDAGALNGAGSRCAANCTNRYATACAAAEDANCATESANVFSPTTATVDGTSGAARANLSADLLACIRATNCSTGRTGLPSGDNPLVCYCGTAGATTCVSHNPPQVSTANGPCLAEMDLAMEVLPRAYDPANVFVTARGAQIGANQFNPNRAIGDAFLLDRCTRNNTTARAVCNP